MLEGITAGFIFSLVLIPGTIWLVKVGVAGTAKQVFVVALGFALSQLFWLLLSIPGLLLMTKNLAPVHLFMHLFAAFVLFYMAFKTSRSRQVGVLNDAGKLPSKRQLFRDAFNRSLAMPMRLPTAMAILLATGVYVNNPPTWRMVPLVMLGSLAGVSWWWGQFFLLTVFFARQVPKHITMRSLNRIRPFCTCLLVVMGIISLLLTR